MLEFVELGLQYLEQISFFALNIFQVIHAWAAPRCKSSSLYFY